MADLFKTTKITQAVPGGPLQEQLVGAVQTSSGVADAGKIVLLSSTGQIDPSVGGSSVAVNLTPVSNPNFQDSGSVTWHVVGSNITATTVSGSVAFGAITSGSNTTATMTVGTGASIVTSGTGVVEGTELATTGSPVNVSNSAPPAHAGQLLISQPGNTTAVWADPLVQGLYPIGTAISTPINPVFIGASDGTNLQAILVDGSGNLKVAQQGSVTISGTVTVSSVTNPVTVTGTVSVSSVGGTVTVSGTVAATQSGSWSVSASQSGTWNIGTVATITNPVTVTGTVSASQSGSWTVAATQSGTWNIGTLTSITNPVAVTGTFFQATQPVSGTVAVSSVSGTVAVTQSTSPWVVSLASTTITGTVAVTQSTSPWVVSGTVTANQGTSPWISNIEASGTALTATGSSLNVNITGGSSSNTQYTGSPAVSAASLVTTAASGYDGANVRPLLTSTTGQLHVIADSGSTTVVTGTVAATQSGTWNIGTLTTITNPVAVTGTFFQATQPVSGTVAVTQSTSPWVVSLTSTTVTGTVA